MMDLRIAMIAASERQAARLAVDKMFIDWRKELWPDRSKDPIWREEHEALVARLENRYPRVLAPLLRQYGSNALM